MARANASIDARLTPIIEDYLRNWAAWGPHVGPLNYFVAGATPLLDKYGVYGLLYDMTVPATAKSRAVDAVRLAPRPPPAAELPVLPCPFLNATDYAGHPLPPHGGPCLEYMGVNATFLYLVRAGARGGDLRITVMASAVKELPVEVSLTSMPGSAAAVNVTTAAGSWGVFAATTTATFPGAVQPGDVLAIRLRNLVDHGYSISSLALEVM